MRDIKISRTKVTGVYDLPKMPEPIVKSKPDWEDSLVGSIVVLFLIVILSLLF